MAHFFIRVRRISRVPLRLGGTNITNTGDGSVVDAEDPAVKRDMAFFANRFVVLGAAEAGAQAFAETMAPNDADADLTLATGIILVTAMELPKGLVINSLTYVSGATGFTDGTTPIKFAGIYTTDGTTLTRVAVSADDAHTAWAADASKVFTGGTFPYTTPAAATYFAAYLAVAGGGAGAVPTLTGQKPLNAAVANLNGTKLYAVDAGSNTALDASFTISSALTASNLIPYIKLA